MDQKPIIVVCGATGNQGMAVTRQLLAAGLWQVTALTRNDRSSPALLLRDLGAKVIIADTRSQASLAAAFAGAYGVFGVTQPWNAEDGVYNTAMEINQAKNIGWAAKEANVQHIVFSTFINPTEMISGVGFIDSKLHIEKMIKLLQLPYTILRPALYMENIVIPQKGGNIAGNVNGKVPIPYVALNDIGKQVALIFNAPDKCLNKTFALIADYASGSEIAGILNRLYPHRNFVYRQRFKLWTKLFQPEISRFSNYMERCYRSLHPEASVDVEETAIDLMNIREFFSRISI